MITKVWECAELTFRATANYTNPFMDVELQVEFVSTEGQKILIPGFWDGGVVWKARFAPTSVGEWSFTSSCTNTVDTGLHGQEGVVTGIPWQEEELQDNPNRRGFVRVHTSGRYFEYEDGTPFYWMGDTLWAVNTLRCDEEALSIYLDDRKKKGFNVIQMVVGHPTADQLDEETSSLFRYDNKYLLNEGGAPYLERYKLINPVYFHHLDLRLRLMLDSGFVPCLMAMWGQELQEIEVEGAKRYLRYLIARYAAFNVMWSPGGEYLFTDNVKGWRELGQEIHRCDPYGHPTSVHSVAPHSGSRHFHGEEWYDFNLIQVGHVLGFKNFIEMLPYLDYQLHPAKPAIMSESWYENHPNTVLDDGIRIIDKHVRFATYVSLLQGCIGQTYGAHGIWSFYNGEQTEKWTDMERPDLWTNDLYLPGSVQMKHVRTIMESVNWQQLEPRPEWASTTAESNVYCAAILRQQYIVYCTGSQAPVPVIVMIMGAEPMGETYEGHWFNPRTGEWSAAVGQYQGYGSGRMWRAFTPDNEDWILRLERSKGSNE